MAEQHNYRASKSSRRNKWEKQNARKEDKPLKGPLNKKKKEKMSRNLTKVLRHHARKIGLNVRTDGYVKVEELLKLTRFKQLNIDHLKQITADCPKQRFGLTEEPDGYYMRANQGHSMDGINAKDLLTQILDPSEIPVCIHGTYLKYWNAIKETGLSKMGRHHIHMTTSEVQNEDARSGFRNSCNLLIFVDAERAMEDGCLFYRSANNVILSPGFDGAIPAQYFSKVILRNDRKVIFPTEEPI